MAPDQDAIKAFRRQMRTEYSILVGRPFPPHLEWCRVSLGTMEEMEQFLEAPAAILDLPPPETAP